MYSFISRTKTTDTKTFWPRLADANTWTTNFKDFNLFQSKTTDIVLFIVLSVRPARFNWNLTRYI
jgi:hypothetical protein